MGVLFSCLLAVFASPTSADAPKIASITPPGAQRSATTTLRIEGSHLAGCKLFVSGSGLTLARPAALPVGAGITVNLTVAAGAAVGPHEIRAVSSEGISPPILFWVGVFPQRGEVEPNDDPTRAETLLPSVATVYGRLDRMGDQDRFTFEGKSGETWAVDCVAKGFHSTLTPLVEVTDDAGAAIARAEVVRGLDPRAVFSLPHDGKYTVTLSDAEGRGGPEYGYLLTVGRAPLVQEFTPHAERPGRTVGLEIKGVNLGSTTRARVSVPRDAQDAFWTAVGTAAGPSLPFAFPISDRPAIGITETDQTMAFPFIPSALEGKLEAYTAARFFFDSEAGDHRQFRLLTRSIGSRLEGEVRILDADGNALAAGDADGNISFAADRKGRYIVEVRNRGGAGPDRYYRLEARKEEPDFSAAALGGGVAVDAGGTVKLPVAIRREGGFTGDVEIYANAMPRGVVLSGGRLPPEAAEKELTLTVSRSAPREPFVLRLRAKARIAGKVVDHVVRPAEVEGRERTYYELLPVVILPPKPAAPP